MSKKVLIISSSPRKGGNSDILCDAFAEGAKESGHAVEKVRIAALKIGYCTGCYACQ
nr:NAD(P)H-dependent oxidoreductase [Kiritimatiellia bacterium]